MAKVILGVGWNQVKQGDVWTTLQLNSRCPSTTGKSRCAEHKLSFLTKLDQTAHVATGDHSVFWECAEHGPEALEKD